MASGAALVRSAFGRTASLGLTVVVNIAILPFIVHHLGERSYGIWVMVGSLLGYYGLLDLGLSSAVSRFVSRALGREDRDDADRFIATGAYLFGACGLAVFAVTLAAAFAVPWFVEDAEEARLFARVVAVMGFALALSFPARCFIGVLNAHLRYDLVSLNEMVFILLRTGGIVWSLATGGGLLALAAITAAADVAHNALLVYQAARVHGSFPIARARVDRARARTLLGFGVYTFAAQIADLLRLQTYPILISTFLGLGSVAVYAISMRLAVMIPSVGIAVMSTLAPVFSRQEGRGALADMRRDYFLTFKLSSYLAVFVVGTTAILAPDFITVWMGSEFSEAAGLLLILLPGMMFAVCQIPTLNLLYGTSRNRFYAATNGIEAALNVGLSLWLIQRHGLVGLALGTAASMIAVKTLLQPLGACQALGLSYPRYLLFRSLPNVAIPALYVALAAVAVRGWLAPDYLRLALVAAALSLGYVPYVFFAGFSASERGRLVGALRSSVARGV